MSLLSQDQQDTSPRASGGLDMGQSLADRDLSGCKDCSLKADVIPPRVKKRLRYSIILFSKICCTEN